MPVLGLGLPSPAALSSPWVGRSPRRTALTGLAPCSPSCCPYRNRQSSWTLRHERGPAQEILVIDDEPPIRKLLRMGLTTQGYEISEAPNGKKSLELLAQKPDLVILDLGLPDMEGLELLRMIRAAE